jgi:DNA-binding transcriptional LysR family regulator
MLVKGVTLRGLEVFEALAETGSVALASEATGLSQPAVSQHMRNLEAALGVALLDHSRRPMRLTAAGRTYLARVDGALSALRLGQSELSVMDLTDLDTLSMGIIDDFDNDLTPHLASTLADSLTSCRFKMITAPSHEINAAVLAGDLHVAIAASQEQPIENITEYPLVRDPFILVTPRDLVVDRTDPVAAMRAHPFLRYASEQMIGQQVEARLEREGLSFERRFELGSHPALMATVARGVGWAITTPLGYMRAARFHGELAAHPLPFEDFARRISLFAGADWSDRVPREIAATMRRLVQAQMIEPALTQLPWLSGDLRLIER